MRTIYASDDYGDFLYLNAATSPAVDVSAATITFGFTVTPDPPASWNELSGQDVTDFSTFGKVRLGLFLGKNGHPVTAGIYWPWLNIQDSPVQQPFMGDQFEVIASGEISNVIDGGGADSSFGDTIDGGGA